MMTLNRYPLLALWAKCCATKLGHTEKQARAIGHGYAQLFCLRRYTRPTGKKAYKPKDKTPEQHKAEKANKGKKGDFYELAETADKQIEFSGESFPAFKGEEIHALLVSTKLHTDETFHNAVEKKFKDDWYKRLEKAFDHFLIGSDALIQTNKFVFNQYKAWRDTCKDGSKVDLEQLETYCIGVHHWESK